MQAHATVLRPRQRGQGARRLARRRMTKRCMGAARRAWPAWTGWRTAATARHHGRGGQCSCVFMICGCRTLLRHRAGAWDARGPPRGPHRVVRPMCLLHSCRTSIRTLALVLIRRWERMHAHAAARRPLKRSIHSSGRGRVGLSSWKHGVAGAGSLHTCRTPSLQHTTIAVFFTVRCGRTTL